jgi:membrane associated rhomboid family serine protease
MFLPLGDEPNPRGVPWVNYSLIFLNCAVYLLVTLPMSYRAVDPANPALLAYLQAIAPSLPSGVSLHQVLQSISAYDLVVFQYGYRPADPHLLTLFTAMFLHSGFLHLAGNMLFLWIYGDNVEFRLGRLGYLFWYLATGAFASLFFAWFDRGSSLPLVGASGAISGVLGFYFVWFPHNKVRLFVFLFPIIWDVFLVPARWVLGLFLIIENLVPFLVSRGGGGVAHGAHIGGFLAGLLVAWAFDRRQRADRRPAFETAGAPAPAVLDTTPEAIAHAIGEERFADAAHQYFRLPSEASRKVLSPHDSLRLAFWLAHHGHARAALAVYQRHLRDYPLGPGAAEAHAGAGLVQLNAFGQPTAAYQHFMEALDHDPAPATEQVVRQAMAEIVARQKYNVGKRP